MAGPLHVSSTRWIKTPAGPSLEIDPGPLPRSPASTEQARVAWVGVVRSLPAADGPGMWEQFLCHAQFAAGKRLWHLEPWRPARSYPATVAALCNPGPEPDPDRLPRKGVRRAHTRGASSSGARSEDR